MVSIGKGRLNSGHSMHGEEVPRFPLWVRLLAKRGYSRVLESNNFWTHGRTGMKHPSGHTEKNHKEPKHYMVNVMKQLDIMVATNIQSLWNDIICKMLHIILLEIAF